MPGNTSIATAENLEFMGSRLIDTTGLGAGSLWYKWTLPNPPPDHYPPIDAPENSEFWSGAMQFDTLNQGPNKMLLAIETVMEVYHSGTNGNATSLADLSLLSQYLDRWPRRFGNYDNGSVMAFEPRVGTWYWINVKHARGEGLFPLNWGNFRYTYLAAPDKCQPSQVVGEECVSVVHIPTVQGEKFVTYLFPGGPWPVDRFNVRHCHGAWHNGVTAGGWLVDNGEQKYSVPPGGPVRDFNAIHVRWARSGDPPQIKNLESPVINNADCRSQPRAELIARCVKTQVDVTVPGTDIALEFYDDPTAPQNAGDVGNRQGASNPVFGLYRRFPVFGANGCGGTWIGPNRIRASFGFQNLTDVTWGNITPTIQLTGGVANPGPPSPATLTFNSVFGTPGDTRVVDIEFDATPAGNENIEVTWKLSDGVHNQTPLVKFTLRPLITLTIPNQSFDFFVSCQGAGARRMIVTLKNIGTLTPRDPTVSFDQLVGFFRGPRDRTNCALMVGQWPIVNILQAFDTIGNNGKSNNLQIFWRFDDLNPPGNAGGWRMSLKSGIYDYGSVSFAGQWGVPW